MDTPDGAETSLACSFCGAGTAQVNHLISGPGVCICDGCVRASYEIIQSLEQKKSPGTSTAEPSRTSATDAAVLSLPVVPGSTHPA